MHLFGKLFEATIGQLANIVASNSRLPMSMMSLWRTRIRQAWSRVFLVGASTCSSNIKTFLDLERLHLQTKTRLDKDDVVFHSSRLLDARAMLPSSTNPLIAPLFFDVKAFIHKFPTSCNVRRSSLALIHSPT